MAQLARPFPGPCICRDPVPVRLGSTGGLVSYSTQLRRPVFHPSLLRQNPPEPPEPAGRVALPQDWRREIPLPEWAPSKESSARRHWRGAGAVSAAERQVLYLLETSHPHLDLPPELLLELLEEANNQPDEQMFKGARDEGWCLRSGRRCAELLAGGRPYRAGDSRWGARAAASCRRARPER